MATKRTPLKRRRLGPAAEAKVWATAFETGHDFFSELEPLGVVHPVKVWPPDARDWQGFRAAAEAAWRRLGAIFMANRDPATCNRARPWAAEQFGEP